MKATISKISSELLLIVSIIYLLFTFSFFDVNYEPLNRITFILYDIFSWIIVVVLIINYKKLNLGSFIRAIFPLILIMLVLSFNAMFIHLGRRSIEFVWTIIPVFLLITLLYRLTAEYTLKYSFKILLGLFLIYHLLGIIGALFKFDYFFGIIPNVLTDNYRYASILDNPNALGEYGFIAFFIITFYVLNTKNLKKRLLYFICYGIIGLGLLVSLSRNSIMMVGILYLYLLLHFKHLDKFLIRIFSIINITIISALVLAFIIKTEFMINFLRLNQGLTGRMDIWSFILNSIRENFFFGIGFGSSGVYLHDYYSTQITSTHNMYLGLLWEMGILAFIILISWMIMLVVSNYRLMKKITSHYHTLLMFNGFYIAFFIGQFFEFSFLKIGAINTFMFVLLGLNQVTLIKAKEEAKTRIKVTHLITGLGNGGAESMLYKILKYANYDKYDLQVISMGDEGYYGTKIKALGIKVSTLNLKKPWYLPKATFNLIKALKDTDVLQTWLYHANLFGLIIGKLMGIKIIIWGIRQSNVEEGNNKTLTVKIARLCAKLSRFTTYILSNSDSSTDVHVELGYKKEKFKTIYNGFELDRYNYDEISNQELRKELGLRDEIIITNVARWDVQKDHPTLFKAISILINEYHVINFKLLLCGMNMTSENQALISLIKQHGLENYVILLGIRNDVNRIMSLSDIFVLSSLGEGFPNVLGEAMACMCGVVTTDVGDCKEIVGDCGIIVPKQNPEKLAQGIYRLLQLSKEDLLELGEKARRRIMGNYDIRVITRLYESLYHN